MNKIGSKLTALFLSFVIGVSVVWLFCSIDFSSKNRLESKHVFQEAANTNQSLKTLYPTNRNGKIDLKFIGFNSSENGIFAEFEVINHNSESAFYSAYSYENKNDSVTPNPDFKVNSIQEKLLYCGTGLEQFEIKPGESVKFKLYGQRLNKYLEKANQNIQVGYWFGLNNNKSWKIIWSEPLQIPDSVKVQLKKEELEQKKQIQ